MGKKSPHLDYDLWKRLQLQREMQRSFKCFISQRVESNKINGIRKKSHFCRFLCSFYSIKVIMTEVVMVTVYNRKLVKNLQWNAFAKMDLFEIVHRNWTWWSLYVPSNSGYSMILWNCKISLKFEVEQRKDRISFKCLVRHCSDVCPMQGVT